MELSPAHSWNGLNLMEVGVFFHLAGKLLFVVIIICGKTSKDIFRTFGLDDLQTFLSQPFCETKHYRIESTQDLGKI